MVKYFIIDHLWTETEEAVPWGTPEVTLHDPIRENPIDHNSLFPTCQERP